MQQWNCGVVFDREMPVGNGDEDFARHPHRFAHERQLVPLAADGLQRRIGNRDVEGLIGKRLWPVGFDPAVGNLREVGAKFGCLARFLSILRTVQPTRRRQVQRQVRQKDIAQRG
jgi:hypothetical protein